MTTALVTGAGGFIGRHLVLALGRLDGVAVRAVPHGVPDAAIEAAVAGAQVIYHLAGVNRPTVPEEFETGNVTFTRRLAAAIERGGEHPLVVFASSTQALLDNPYGRSKRAAEAVLSGLAERGAAAVLVYRLTNVYGKWCRPDHNSAVATFCHRVARDLPITVHDPAAPLRLVHIDDVVDALTALAHSGPPAGTFEIREVHPIDEATVGGVAEAIRSFRAIRDTLWIPDLSSRLTRRLYGTYVSYLDDRDFAYALPQRADARGVLAEFIKSPGGGQVFVSRSGPGVTRGNHWHHTKTEKFLVLEGDAVIRFRRIGEDAITAYAVSGRDFRVLDIPPGWTHSIENVGDGELVVLFWASEPFDPERPDTIPEEVVRAQA